MGTEVSPHHPIKKKNLYGSRALDLKINILVAVASSFPTLVNCFCSFVPLMHQEWSFFPSTLLFGSHSSSLALWYTLAVKEIGLF